MTKYSVIIPIYNMEEYLEDCINSVIVQNNDTIEIILVNDGSTDNSLTICKNFQKRYNNIIVIDKKNTGTTDTILEGIRKARGEYTCFIDADDKITSNYFEVLDEYVNQKFDIILYNYMKMYKNNTVNMEINKIPYGILDKKLIKDLHKNFFRDFKRYSLYRWNKVIKTEILKNNITKINDNVIYFEDLVISFLNLLSSERIIYIKDYIYMYRMRKNSVSHSVNERIFIDMKKVQNKMIEILNEQGYDLNKKYQLKLYFLYQYARYSLKSEKKYYKEKIKFKDIKCTKDLDKKIVLLLYKFRLKNLYKIITKYKLKKEKSKNKEYFD